MVKVFLFLKNFFIYNWWIQIIFGLLLSIVLFFNKCFISSVVVLIIFGGTTIKSIYTNSKEIPVPDAIIDADLLRQAGLGKPTVYYLDRQNKKEK